MNGGTGFGIDFADLQVIAGDFEAEALGVAGKRGLDYPAGRGLGWIVKEKVGRRDFGREDGTFERVGDGNFRGLVEGWGECRAGGRMESGTADEENRDCAGSESKHNPGG